MCRLVLVTQIQKKRVSDAPIKIVLLLYRSCCCTTATTIWNGNYPITTTSATSAASAASAADAIVTTNAPSCGPS